MPKSLVVRSPGQRQLEYGGYMQDYWFKMTHFSQLNLWPTLNLIKQRHTQKIKHFTFIYFNQMYLNLLLFEVLGSGSLKLTESALKSHQNRSNFHSFCHQTYQQIISRIHARFLMQNDPLFITDQLLNLRKQSRVSQTKAHTQKKPFYIRIS